MVQKASALGKGKALLDAVSFAASVETALKPHRWYFSGKKKGVV